MSLPKPPFPCVSSSQTELLPGYTCTNDFFHVPSDTIPPDFPYALEHDTLGARIPYRYYTGPGPPHPSVGLPGDIHYDSLSDSSPAYASPKGYTRTLTGWTPWSGAGNFVHHPFLPAYALCPVWDETASTTIAHEWGHVDSTSQSRLLEKEVSKFKAAADARPRADIEARTHRASDGADVLTTLSLCGAPLLTHLSSKRNAFIAHVTEWTAENARVEVELVKANAELAEASRTSISTLEDKLKDVEAARIVLQTNHSTLVAAHAASDATLVANIAAIKTSFAGAREEWNNAKKALLGQLESEQHTAEEVEVILAEKDEEIARLGARLENGQTEARETEMVLKATLAAKYEEITRLGVRLNAVENSHVARSELVAKETELAAVQNAHQALLQSKDAQVARLEKDIEALRKGSNVDMGTGPDSASDSNSTGPAPPTAVPVTRRVPARTSPIGMNSKNTSVASASNRPSGSGTSRSPLNSREMSGNRVQNGPGSWASLPPRPPCPSDTSAFNPLYPRKLDTLTRKQAQPRPSGTSALNPLNLRKHDTLIRKQGSSTTDNLTSTPKRHRPDEPRREGKQKATPTARSSLSEDDDLDELLDRSSGTQSSPDPLTLHSTPFKHASHNSPTRHQLGYVGDPPAVQRLRNRHRQLSKEIVISDSDEFSDRPNQSQSAGAHRHTQRQESAYAREEITRLEAKESARSSVPHLDLSLMQRRPIASSMKPKCTDAVHSKGNPFRPKPTGGDQLGEHPSSASTSNPSKSRQKSPSQAKQGDSVELPLEAWSCGLKIYDTGTLKFFFVWNPQTCTASVRCNREQGPLTVIEEIRINQIQDIKATNGAPTTPSKLLIQFCTHTYDRKGRTEETYKPGSQGANGKLTFKFSVQSADWSNAKYQTMVADLRKQIIGVGGGSTYIDAHHSDILWKEVIGAQEAYNYYHPKRSERATFFQVTAEASNPGSSVSAIPASSIARRITPPQLAHQLKEPLHARKLPSADTEEMSAASLDPSPESVPTSILPAANSGSPAVSVPSAPSLPPPASVSVLPTRALESMAEPIPDPLAIKREIVEDTGKVLKRKRSATASGDTRQMKRSAEGKARAVEREVIDLTLSSDDEDGDKAANKSGDSRAAPVDVDAEGDANEKDNGLPTPPSLPLPLPLPPSQYGHRKQVENSDSHPEPNNHAEMEVACEPTAQPAALPLEEPLLTSSSAHTTAHTTSTIAKTEPIDAPLLDSIPPSRPPLSQAHVRLAFIKEEDNLLCLACFRIAKSTITIIPPTNTAAVDHLTAAHGELVTFLLAQSPVDLKKAWKKMKAEGGKERGRG